MISRFLCWLGFHRPPPHHDPRRSIIWMCERRGCGQLLAGEAAGRRR